MKQKINPGFHIAGLLLIYLKCNMCLDRYEKNRICNFMPGHYPLLTTTHSPKHQILVKKKDISVVHCAPFTWIFLQIMKNMLILKITNIRHGFAIDYYIMCDH